MIISMKMHAKREEIDEVRASSRTSATKSTRSKEKSAS